MSWRTSIARRPEASSAWSKSAPHPWDAELSENYLRRVATPHQQHSAAWKDVDLHELRGQALKNAATEIFADSIAASGSNELVGELNLPRDSPPRP